MKDDTTLTHTHDKSYHLQVDEVSITKTRQVWMIAQMMPLPANIDTADYMLSNDDNKNVHVIKRVQQIIELSEKQPAKTNKFER